MNAARTIPGRPINDGANTSKKIIDLIALTLDQSDNLDADSIRDELSRSATAIGLLALGGHLRNGELILIADGLRLTINVPVGEAALSATEDLRQPRLANSALDWALHIPVPDSLAAVIRAAERACGHVATSAAPDEAPASREASARLGTIDLSRLNEVRISR